MAKKRRQSDGRSRRQARVGLSPAETLQETGATDALASLVERDGGAVLGAYRDPFGGKPVLIVSLPIERVEPTPFQRDPSDPHVKRLMTVIETLDRFLDPIIVVRQRRPLLDTERQPPAAGDEAPRRAGRWSRCSFPRRRWPTRSWRSTPRRRTTCARSRSRPSAWRARSPGSRASLKRRSRSSSSSPRFSRWARRTSPGRV